MGTRPLPPDLCRPVLSANADRSSFESIAPETGGEIFRLRTTSISAISNSVEDGASYYTLAY